MPAPWMPIPFDHIEQVDNDRKLTKHPASYLDGFAYAWMKAERGAPLTRRQLAQWAEWSQHRARACLRDVKERRNEWRFTQKPPPNKPGSVTQKRPPITHEYDHLEPFSDHENSSKRPERNHETTYRARGSTNTTTTTTTDHTILSDVDNVVSMASDGQHVTEYRSTEEQTTTIQRQR